MPLGYRRSYSRSPPPQRRSRSRSRNRYTSSSFRNSDSRYYGNDSSSSRHYGYDTSRRVTVNSRDYYSASNSNSSSNYRDSREYRSSRYATNSEEDDAELDQCRIHVADLADTVSKEEVEQEFMRFGRLKEVWMVN